MDDRSEERVWKFAITVAALLLAYCAYLFFSHFTQLSSGVALCIRAFSQGASAFWGYVAGTIGGQAASTVLLTAIVVPVTTVSVYTIFRKATEKPKALIVAIGLFLTPLFIDFFRDELDHRPIQQMLVSVFGIVSFLSASFFWTKAPEFGSRASQFLARITAFGLFLLPSLCMLGYVLMTAHGEGKAFKDHFTAANILGLVGLVVTAFLGIGLARFYEMP